MRFLEHNEIEEWCEERGIAASSLTERSREHAYHSIWRSSLAADAPSPAELGKIDVLLTELEPWDECLIWIVSWGIWQSSEDWPEFYAARGQHGERRAIDVAPGLLLGPSDRAYGREYLERALRFGWDVQVVAALDGLVSRRRGELSHDGWIALLERTV
jgi:hypothetical protein